MAVRGRRQRVGGPVRVQAGASSWQTGRSRPTIGWRLVHAPLPSLRVPPVTPLRLAVVASALIAAAIGCSAASSGAGGISQVPAPAFTGTPPAGAPATCAPGEHYAWVAGGLCDGGPTYLVCGGSGWDQYTCSDPTCDGWAGCPPITVPPPDGGYGCTLDAECAEGEVCDLDTGACVVGTATTTPCMDDSSCSGGAFCDTTLSVCVAADASAVDGGAG
jgi:hypothetical protein